MGRPSNPLVGEYFRRGNKLKDKSNRYEHTCRKCGILDKTGRPEKLIDHLVKCPYLGQEEREDVLARHFNHRSGMRGERDGSSSRSATPPTYGGLEGLAEAARRVSAHEPPANPNTLPTSSVPIDPTIGHANTHFYENSVPAQALPPHSNNDTNQEFQNIPNIHETSSPEVHSLYTIVDDLDDNEQDVNRVAETSTNPALALPQALSTSLSSPVPPTLTQQPAMPGHTESPVVFPSNNGFVPALHRTLAEPVHSSVPQTQSSTSSATPNQDSSHDSFSSPPATRAISPPQNIASVPDSYTIETNVASDTGDSPKAARPKRTSKLKPQQREKTAKVRQQGACIRCRLLKKPCSGEDPCQQCQNVHNPRMWRHPCQRVKLHEEITLYSAGLQLELANNNVRNLEEKHVRIIDQPESYIRVSFGSSDASVSFRACRLRSTPSTEAQCQEPEVFLIEHSPSTFSQTDLLKLNRYLKEEYAQLFDREQNSIMRGTLKLAKRLAADQNDEILYGALELYAATLLLVDDEIVIKLVLEEAGQPRPLQKPITKDTASLSYSLVRDQLCAAIESLAATHVHKLLIKLETRLQRPKASLFETYLACFLLLNCAERMCWLYRKWQSPETEPRPWPLQNQQASQLVQQGETMASVLHMIMDMRNVLPKPIVRDNGTLSGAPKACEDARSWFNEIDVSVEALRNLEERPYLANDCRSMDGRFWARTLAVDDKLDGLALGRVTTGAFRAV